MMAPGGSAPPPTPANGAGTPVPGGFTPVPSAHGSAAPGSPATVNPTSSVPPSLVGTVLADRYRVIKKLGEGGMGSVYLAEHTTINKKLAIKVLSSEYSHKQDLVDRFLQEARAASMIEQENVVEITDFGSTPSGSVFFVMEFLNGEDLSKTVKKLGPMPWARVKPIMLQICTALTAAHDVGIVHRDMKPENCYRIRRGGSDDFIKVLDFGIAKVTTDDGEGKGLTRTGMIFGTPEYMSPEQAKGEKVDHRVDVYAVGVILFELLTGRVPFTADTFMGILTKHMFEAPPIPSSVHPDVEVPPKVEAIILKALQKDREYRFQSMESLAAAIEAVGTDSAAVSVVAERVAMPSRGETRYSSNTGVPVAMAPPGPAPRRKGGAGMLIGVAAFVLALGGAAGVILLQDDDDGRAKTQAKAPAKSVVAVGADPKPNDPKTTPKAPKKDPKAVDPPESDGGEDSPATPTAVAITVFTPDVAGDIVDETGAVIGHTNEAFELPVGEAAVALKVLAEGYEEALLSVVPSEEQTLEPELTKVPKRKNGGRRNGKRNGGRNNGGTTKPSGDGGTTKPSGDGGTTKPSGDGGTTKPSGGGGSPDLKDPFKKR